MKKLVRNIFLREYKISDLDRHIFLLRMNRVYEKFDSKVIEKEKNWLKKSIDNSTKHNPNYFVLAIFFEKELIGNIVLEKIDYKNKTGNIGYWIGKNFQGNGYATKALTIFLDDIKSKFKIKTIFAETDVKNIGSQRVLEKNGFEIIGKKGNKFFWILEL
jgi:RimJ/RimL family protein N-acetyltransferase